MHKTMAGINNKLFRQYCCFTKYKVNLDKDDKFSLAEEAKDSTDQDELITSMTEYLSVLNIIKPKSPFTDGCLIPYGKNFEAFELYTYVALQHILSKKPADEYLAVASFYPHGTTQTSAMNTIYSDLVRNVNDCITIAEFCDWFDNLFQQVKTDGEFTPKLSNVLPKTGSPRSKSTDSCVVKTANAMPVSFYKDTLQIFLPGKESDLIDEFLSKIFDPEHKFV